jgi:thioredoxin-related protein
MNLNRVNSVFLVVLTLVLSNSVCAQIRAFNSISNEIEWEKLDSALAKAKIQNKLILLAFHAQGCPYCKKMKDLIYSDPEMKRLIQQYFIPVELDLENPTDFIYKGVVMNSAALANILEVTGTPTLTFLNDEGDLVAFQPGYLNPRLFAKLIKYVGTGKYTMVSFAEFSKNEK